MRGCHPKDTIVLTVFLCYVSLFYTYILFWACLSFYNNGSCYSYYEPSFQLPINDESDSEDFDGNRTIDPKQSLNDDSDRSDEESIDRDDDLNATYAPVWSITTNGMRPTNYICPTAWFISTSSWPAQTLQLF